MLFDILSPRGWAPFTDMDRLLAEFGNTLAQSQGIHSAVDVVANDDEAIVAFAAPGLNRDSIEVTVLGDTLTVRGTPAPEEQPAGEWLRRERRREGFQRSVRLPFAVDEQRTRASYRDGLLAVHAPRAEATKPRRIDIAAA